MSEFSISIENLNKKYEETSALKNISLQVEKGELFGLIGPDGAGKTTLIRIMVTVLLADSGNAKVESLDVVKDFRKIRNIIGYMPGRFSLYQDLSVEENIQFFATIFGTTLEENYDLVKPVYSQIEPFKTRKAGRLSGGMKQKLALSCALIHKPSVLFLDEPTTGVDAVSRTEFWEMLGNLKQKGITIFVSTPYMDEASMCDRVALIQNGEIMAIDTPLGIIGTFDKELVAIKTLDNYQLIQDLRKHPETDSCHLFGQYVHYTTVSRKADRKEISTYLEKMNHEGIEINAISPGIEDCFMQLMSKR